MEQSDRLHPWPRRTSARGWIIRRFSKLLNAPTALRDAHGNPHDRQWIGHHGEAIAARFLEATGHRILARNFKKQPGGGEVDIIAQHRKLLLFVEVKTRAADARIRPFDAVDRDKQKLIERGANEWLRKLRTREIPWRFDVIEVWLAEGEKPRLNHIRDAF